MIIDPSDHLTPVKSIAILSALGGVALTVYKPRNGKIDPAAIYVPLLLFVGMGIVDSLVKFAQHNYVSDSEAAPFSAMLFLNAFVSGLLVSLFLRRSHRNFLRPPVWGWGVLLGAVNFGSIFFLVRALNHLSPGGQSMDSSVIFGINNIGIVALSVLAGLLIFKEFLKTLNWVGILLSAVAPLLFMLA
jgi:drug/metabolite transporter (DMT)-like permease